MKKSELYRKLQNAQPNILKKLNIEKEELNYIKEKLLNDKLGLKINFTEMDNEEKTNYILLEENKKLGINTKESNNNLLIEGDNYHALKALHKVGVKVDVIYIDPPYNTGKEFIYQDDFGVDKVVGFDDPHKHSKWLSFMKKRLILAKSLLTDKGVIFVSIDDNEQAYLKVLMDEIFGEKNFLNQLVWVSNKKGRQISTAPYAKTYEYILVYSKIQQIDFPNAIISRKEAERDMPAIYVFKKIEIKTDQKGKYIIQNELHNTNINAFNINTRQNLFYDIFTNGKEITLDRQKVRGGGAYKLILPPKNQEGLQGVWRWSKDKVTKDFFDLEVVQHKDTFKIYTKVRKIGYTPKDLLLSSKMTTKSGGNDLKLLGLSNFSFPKPVSLIKFLVSTCANKNSTILDFFAGSGTTGQAVLELNAKDGGNRRFILVTNNEMKGIDTIKEPEKGIARAITRERLFRVINGKGSNGDSIKWNYKGGYLSDNSVKYLQVKLLDKIEGEFEDIDKVKELYQKEFNKDISIVDFKE